MRGTRSLLLLATALGLAACSMLSSGGGDGDDAEPYPAGCATFELSARRCDAIVEEIASRLGIDRAAVLWIELLGDPGCGGAPGVLCTRTTAFVVRVRFNLVDGRTPEDSVFCGVGGQYSILCTESPQILLSSPIGDGYRDIPCTGEAPEGCASPVPTVDPEVAPGAVPLRVDALDISLDHRGRYEVKLGEVSLANGILQDASFTLAEMSPTSFAMTADGIRLEVLSLEPDGKPFLNVYEHGWRPGLERVEVRLLFEITDFEAGAALQVRDVVVH